MAVEITRTELSVLEAQTAASKADDAKAARRMLALALVLEGVDRRTSAETCGMDRQTLRDWVHRYNAEGLAGLSNRRSAGPSPLLNPDQKAALAQMVREGPDLGADGVVRWRRVDLKRRIEARFGVVMHERTVGKQLAALGFRRLSVRPQHLKSNPEARRRLKKLRGEGSRRPAGVRPGQVSGGLVSGVSRIGKRSGGPVSRRTREWASRER